MNRSFVYIFLLSLFIALNTRLYSQANKADSLLRKATAIYNTLPDSSMRFCKEAQQVSKKESLKEQLAYSYVCEARYLLLKGELKPTQEKLNEAIGLFIALKNNRGLAKCYSLKSILMGRLGNYAEELELLLESKKLYVRSGDTAGVISASINLSSAYIKTGDAEKAIETLDAIRSLAKGPQPNDFYTEVHYGMAFMRKEDPSKALVHFQNCVDAAKKFKMTDSEITGLTHLAACYHVMGQKQASARYFKEALDLSRKNNLVVEESEALKDLIPLLEEDKDYPAAYQALKRYKFLQDSLFSLEKIKSIHEVENKLKLTEKEKIIAEQSLALEKENAELASSKFRGILLTGGVIVLIAAVAFLFMYLRRTRNLYTLIQVQKKEVEFQKERVEAKNKEVTDSINYARYIQYGMLPSEKSITALFPDHFILYKPKDIVAGDFYWVEKTARGNSLLAACDCTGHGVPGAMVSIVACNALTRAVKEFKLADPAKILDKVNELMQEAFSKNDYEIKDGMDGVLCMFDKASLQLQVAAANNPLWIIGSSISGIEKDALELSQVSPDKQPVGKFDEEIKPFELKTINLNKGEMLYLFTDGYADQFGGPKGKKFKYKQLAELMLSIAHLPLNDQKIKLNTEFEGWRGKLDQVDDVLVIGVRV